MRRVIVSFFGSGYLRPAPGTWGTAAALAVYAGIHRAIAQPGTVSWTSFNLVIVALMTAFTVAGIALGPWAEQHYGRKDPSTFVLDEAVGYWLAMIFLPVGAGQGQLAMAMTVQFFLFRLADIIKPSPARRSQALPAGWGIVVDDLIAAAYCNLAGQVLFRTVLAGRGLW